MVGVPEAFARSTVEREGRAGADWVTELPGILDGLLGRWGCVPDGEVMHGGVGVIVPVRRADGGAGVVKVSFPHPANAHEPDTLIHGDLHAGNILRADREPWLAVDPKGLAGDPAYDGGALFKSRALALLRADDLGGAVHRMLDVFAEAAELDRERVRRWAQVHAVQAAFRGRRRGFRVARGGARLRGVIEFADRLAELLVEPARA
ncbi:aminoglycoside phosphotransferase family protein [Pseudonocardia acaciae]|uniref:aminoglycoside phosphotransferase family protein n=1 Tax=Pseudonocardia acaciae TaxID=551276 RepID=UPI00048ED636|nr:aminoglycoside phosphotransferase family protein [Pseudonocardia acaciae]